MHLERRQVIEHIRVIRERIGVIICAPLNLQEIMQCINLKILHMSGLKHYIHSEINIY